MIWSSYSRSIIHDSLHWYRHHITIIAVIDYYLGTPHLSPPQYKQITTTHHELSFPQYNHAHAERPKNTKREGKDRKSRTRRRNSLSLALSLSATVSRHSWTTTTTTPRRKGRRNRNSHRYHGGRRNSSTTEALRGGRPFYNYHRMPSRLSAPLLTVDAGKMHKVDTTNPENLHGMWMGEFLPCSPVWERLN